jgi:HSP20 family protein
MFPEPRLDFVLAQYRYFSKTNEYSNPRGRWEMNETASKVPVTEEKAPERSTESQTWRPFESLRREVYRLFEDFDRDLRRPLRRPAFDVDPFWRRQLKWGGAPAVDVVETDDAYELTADLPGIDEKNIEVKLAEGGLTIKGERQEEKEEKKKDYYLHERHFGSFERHFALPDGVDADKIEASFKNGVLTVRLPKKPEAIRPEKKIEVKTG